MSIRQTSNGGMKLGGVIIDTSKKLCDIAKGEYKKYLIQSEISSSPPQFGYLFVNLQGTPTCPTSKGVYLRYADDDELFCTFHDNETEQFFDGKRKLLKVAADNAFKKYDKTCNLSVIETLSAFGIQELNNKTADEQVKYMIENWVPVSAVDAQDIANRGGIVVAGRENGGHTAVVVPGKLVKKRDGIYYPMVEGGGSEDGKSNGTKSAGDVWGTEVRSQVKYYTPKYIPE